MSDSHTALNYHLRPVAVLVGVGIIFFFCQGLLAEARVAIQPGIYLGALYVWVAGLLFLIAWPTWVRRLNDDNVVFARSVWCSCGAVFLALSIPYAERFLLLMTPIFGVFYAALHLPRRRVVWVLFLSWSLYVVSLVFIGAGYLSISADAESLVNGRFEALSFAAFSIMLVSAMLVSNDIIQVRATLEAQNETLRTVMEQTQELALRDELTGVHNRRYVLEVLARQKALADRGQQRFAVCYCDLDHFKLINDQYGHAAGDEALMAFAKLAQATVRSVDYVARLGGEEFLLVLVGVEDAVAQQVASRLVTRTRELKPNRVKSLGELTVSIGLTSYRARESIDELLRRADAALYEAKQGGRDQVVVYTSEESRQAS